MTDIQVKKQPRFVGNVRETATGGPSGGGGSNNSLQPQKEGQSRLCLLTVVFLNLFNVTLINTLANQLSIVS